MTGSNVKVGEWITFKADVEQSAQVIAIRRDRWRGIEFKVNVEDGGPEYRGIQWIPARDCFDFGDDAC